MPRASELTQQLWPSRYSSLAWVPWNNDDVSLESYCQVRKRFSPARFADDFLTRNVARRFDGFHSDEEAVCEWVENQVWPALRRALPKIMSAVYYGAMLAEPVWDTSSGEMRLASLHVCHPDVWWGGEVVRDDTTNEIVRWQRTNTPKGSVEFFDKAGRRIIAHWSWGNDFDNAWGDPVARRVYPWYALVSNMVKWEGIGVETCALPRLILLDRASDEEAQAYLTAVQDLGSNGAIRFPANMVDQVTPLSSAFGGGSPFDVPIRRAYTGIFAAYYEPPLIHSEAQFGTRAQASTQLEAWMGTETAIAEEVAEQVIMDQVIRPAVALRFGPGADPGDVRIKDAAPVNMVEWANILAGLFNIGAFDPTSEESLNFVAERFGLPMEERKQTVGEVPAVVNGGEAVPQGQEAQPNA